MSTVFSIDEIVAQHQTVYDVYFSQADTTGSGAIGALDAGNFLKHSKLKPDILKTIWELADPIGKGYLDRQSFYIALKLIALSQSGQDVNLEKINSVAPAPKLGDLSSSNITSLITSDDPWYIKASSRISFDKIFDSLSPINDKITGARVKPFLMNSKLPVDILGKIWELSDLDQDGNLDREEFLIAMQLVTKSKEGTIIPDNLPPSLLPFKVRSTVNINSPSSLGSPSAPAYVLNNEIKPWVVSIEEKANSDINFDQIDIEKRGHVNGSECKETFIKTGLSQMILANIWNLCDIGSTGKLNNEQFALAMHFVNKKIATGLDAPPDLLPEMVPPSFRKKTNTGEITIESKELEELQLQVTELQREKLFYEQRASEHENFTRQKRSELSNLELEMESLFKTLQGREMKKVEEEQKLVDLEDKLVKIDTEVIELREKYSGEKTEIEGLKVQINNMEMAMRTKDNDLNRIKVELKKFTQEQTNLEIKLDSRKNYFIEMNSNLKAATTEVTKNENKLELLKRLQSNLNRLLNEYDKNSVPEGDSNELNSEIKKLEDEHIELNIEIKNAIEITNNNLVFVKEEQNNFPANNGFVAEFPVESSFGEDPFQAFDPFKDNSNNISSDPFKSEIVNSFKDDPFKDNDILANDPFKTEGTNTSDPFGASGVPLTDKIALSNIEKDPFASDPFGGAPTLSNNMANTSVGGFGDDDPFANFLKKREGAPPPPRPAPPTARAQTPSLKPAKTTIDPTQRPQSSMDFTRNNKLDLFSTDFVDPFGGNNSTTGTNISQNKIPEVSIDPFASAGAPAGDWDAFGNAFNSPKTEDIKNKDDASAWDPFG